MSETFPRVQSPESSPPVDNAPSISALFSQLAQSTQELVQQEVALAKTEFSQAATKTATAGAKIAAGALVLYAGFMLLLLAAVFGLRQADFSWWASALIVGGVTALIGVVLLLMAKAQLRTISFLPQHTVESLKDDQRWAKGKMP